ncbi:hypothetical protein W97_02727 [Coniosporium apollinis CBS 100218]|uniref:Uncharacterized protein n=1 Tax=Coniosporium apollinis (strain CBS 100218) TaxID=1168221 RepID=R7YNV4_CONA1|nr:uncharacterized protein W97_02727 [Coniosporium apollinis CBS 100218]EON63499.1 hypothetical protein W97_02727 [Coniosporium apollinis CBS 100218]
MSTLGVEDLAEIISNANIHNRKAGNYNARMREVEGQLQAAVDKLVKPQAEHGSQIAVLHLDNIKAKL